MRIGCVAASALVAILLTAGSASAGQKPAPAAEEVIVTHTGSGQELRGRLVELSPASLAMLVNGQRVEIPMDDVLRIDARGDSVKDGAIIGAAVMAGLTGLSCAAFGDAEYCVTALIVNTGFGALAGAGIDALHKGRTPIYIKAGKAGGAVGLKFSW
jgi:hypothetical protein